MPDSTPFDLLSPVLFHGRHAEIKTLAPLENGNWQVGLVTLEDQRFHTIIWPLTQLERISSPLERTEKLDFDPSWKFNSLVDALRFKYAYLYDPLFSLSTTRIDALPHQIEAIYDKIVPSAEQRFLLADDAGLGKTIMAGMVMKELRARGRASRVLILSPAPLVRQWIREMRQLFELEFVPYDSGFVRNLKLGTGPEANPWDKHPYIITSIDYARREEVKRELERARPWDLLIIDEAHKCKCNRYGDKIEPTERFRLAQSVTIKDHAENVLLLTATPHDGNPYPFYALLTLIDPYIAPDEESLERNRVSRTMIRRLKEDVLDWDGKPLFKPREVRTIPLRFDSDETKFYRDLTSYVSYYYNLSKGDEKRRAVGFAMTLLQKRMVSSLYAVRNSLLNRAARLEEQLRNAAKAEDDRRKAEQAAVELEELEEDLEDLRRASLEEEVLAASLGTRAEVGAEVRRLRRLAKDADRLVVTEMDARTGAPTFKPDSKATAFLEFVDVLLKKNAKEKLLVFTEYVNTLDYIFSLLKSAGRKYRLTKIHGSMDMEAREAAEDEFNGPAQILVATDAAGEGLNLQVAHIMVNYELPWNPNRLEQRMGRLHRYGQTEVVHVHNLLITNTREGEIFHRLLQKIDRQREQMGDRVFDVLGTLLQDVNLTRLVMDLLSVEDRGRFEKFLEEKLERPIEERNRTLVEFIEERALVRQQIHLAPQLAKLKQSQEQAIGPEDLVRFLALVLPKLTGGKLTRRSDGLYTLNVPLDLADREVVHPVYKDVTFDREEAKKLGRGKATFLALGHPAIDRVVQYVLSFNWGGRAAVKLDPQGRRGVIFNYQVRITDAEGKTVGERVLSYFAQPDQGLAKISPGWHWDLMDHPGGLDDFERELVAPVVSEVRTWESRARNRAITDSQAFRDELASMREREIKIKEEDAERYFQQRLSELDRRLREQKAQSHLRDMSLAIRNTEATIEEKKHEWGGRKQALKLEKSLVFQAPELHSLSVVLPEAKPGKGGHDPEERRAVEAAAMAFAMEFERSQGRGPRDVSLEFVGYDIESSDVGDRRFIEVKGFKDTGSLEITLNEWRVAQRLSEAYWLYVVERALDKPRLFLVRNPAAKFRHVDVLGADIRFRIDSWQEYADEA